MSLSLRIVAVAFFCVVVFSSSILVAQTASATVWDLGVLASGKTYPTNISISNASCPGTHTLALSRERLDWVEIVGSPTLADLPSGQTREVKLIVDLRNREPGTYRGNLRVQCLTCPRTCSQDVGVFEVTVKVAQAEAVRPSAAPSPRATPGPVQPDPFPQTREVPAAEYRRAVAEFTQAFAAAEQARQRLVVLRPDDRKPDPIDCYFHPWHPGCQDLWTTLERERGLEWNAAARQSLSPPWGTCEEQGSEEPAKMNPWVAGAIGWAVSKALDHVWDVGVCLYKADGPDGRGLEGSDGMKKFGDCIVKPKGKSISGSRAAWGSQGLDASASPMSDSFANTDAVQLSGHWTQWLNRDTPGGNGDYETLQEFLKAGQACPQPLSVECQTADGLRWQEAGQTYSCTTEGGGLCRNDAQPAGSRCRDYRVRFLCP